MQHQRHVERGCDLVVVENSQIAPSPIATRVVLRKRALQAPALPESVSFGSTRPLDAEPAAENDTTIEEPSLVNVACGSLYQHSEESHPSVYRHG